MNQIKKSNHHWTGPEYLCAYDSCECGALRDPYTKEILYGYEGNGTCDEEET